MSELDDKKGTPEAPPAEDEKDDGAAEDDGEEEEEEEELDLDEGLTPDELVEKGDACKGEDLTSAVTYYSEAVERKIKSLGAAVDDEIHPELAGFYFKYGDALLEEQEALYSEEVFHQQKEPEDGADGEPSDMEVTFGILDMAKRCFEHRVKISEEEGPLDQEAGEMLILVHLRRGDFYCLEDNEEGWIAESKDALEYVNKFAPNNKERRVEVLLPLALAMHRGGLYADALENLNKAKAVISELIPECDANPDKKKRYTDCLAEVDEKIEETKKDIEADKETTKEEVKEEIKKITTESTSFDAPTRSEEPVQIAVKRKAKDASGNEAKRPNTSAATEPEKKAAE
jgi:tetratricopeptide (TPR) repeat protein